MKSVTKYVSRDGRLFSDEDSCLRHESLQDEADAVCAIIGPAVKDDGCNFANGHGYVQRDPDAVFRAEKALRDACLRLHGNDNPRYLCDSNSPFCSVSVRLRCIDVKGREWGQPYYANNMNEGDQVEWAR